MQRSFAIALLLLNLSACGTVETLMAPKTETPEQTAARNRARIERETTERFAVCMDRVVGKTGMFVAPEAKRKAAETCNEVARAAP